jgi:hypothetical protein
MIEQLARALAASWRKLGLPFAGIEALAAE